MVHVVQLDRGAEPLAEGGPKRVEVLGQQTRVPRRFEAAIFKRDMSYLGSGEFCFVFPYGSMRARRAGSDAKPCKSSGRRFGSRTQTSVSAGQEAAPMLRCTASGSTASCNAASCGPLGMSIQTWARSRGRLRAGAAARVERLRAAQAAARAPS